MLPVSVPFKPGETVISFASRLCAAHGIGFDLNGFLGYLGTNLAALLTGTDHALGRIAAMTGVPINCLRDHSVRIEPGSRMLRSERLAEETHYRSKIRVCASCLQEDIANCQERDWPIQIWQRLPWILGPIRACPIHICTLTDAENDAPARLGANWTDVALRSLASWTPDEAAPLVAHDFNLQRYLLGRLDGKKNDKTPFLDGLEWHAAARLSEMVGVLAVHGAVRNVDWLMAKDWHAAGNAGFQVLQSGKANLFALLDDQRAKLAGKGLGKEGPQATFGKFYTWLRDSAQHPAFDPVRSILREYVVERFPFEPGEIVLRKPVEARRWHTIRSVHKEFKVHPKRIRKILKAHGLTQPDSDRHIDDRVLIEPSVATRLFSSVADAIPLTQVEDYIGAGRVQSKLLAEAGHLKAIDGQGTSSLKWHMFPKGELDTFLSRLLANSVECDTVPPGCGTIPDVARRTVEKRAMKVVDLALSEPELWKGRLRGARGYLSLLLNVHQVRAILAVDRQAEIGIAEAARRIGTTERAVKALMRNGVLRSTLVKARNNVTLPMVEPEEIERFVRQFVSLNSLRKRHGNLFYTTHQIHQSFAISPALSGTEFFASFYNVADIEAALKA